MRFVAFEENGIAGLAIETADGYRGCLSNDPAYPGSLDDLVRQGDNAFSSAAETLARCYPVDLDKMRFLPPFMQAQKNICVGLNYRAHTAEGSYEQPDYPTLFARFASGFIGHNEPILRPKASEKLDYEGELVAIVGKTAKNVSRAEALDYVSGYSIFNDGSIRDYQRRTPQWTAGKNFDDTGAFGPAFVTADALPPGCKGLTLQTRLNGQVVQEAPIDDMVFPVDELVSTCSQFMTLVPGDVIITGTPSGVGHARRPPLWMKEGDICEIEIDQVGLLSNPIKNA